MSMSAEPGAASGRCGRRRAHDYCWDIPLRAIFEHLRRAAPAGRLATSAVIITMLLLAAACSPASDSDSADSAPSAEPTSTTAGPDTGSGTEPESNPDPESDDTDSDDTDPDDTGSADDGAGDDADGALASDAVRDLLAELDGQLAIGNGPVVAVARPDGQRYIELDGGQTNLASQPTWSPDGSRLAWSSVSPLAQEARVQAFDEEGVADGDPLVSDVPGQPIFYFQWRNDGNELLYLRNSSRRRTVEAGVLGPGGPARWLADGDPFFVAWAPDAPTIAAHVGEERVALFDPAEAAASAAPSDEDDPGGPLPVPRDPVAGNDLTEGGGFSAPAWLDDTTLLAVVSEALSAVDVETGAVDRLIDLSGPIRFVLSPDRSRVAFQVASDLAGDDDVLEVGATPVQDSGADVSLVVVEIEDRSVNVVTDRAAVAWEWSPDSTKLAWLEFDGPISRRQARWRFWSADGDVVGDSRSPSLRLSLKEMVNYLPFFAQYSFSLRRWSPDSSAFALVGAFNGRDGIWIHLVDVPANPVLVAPGDVVNWGFGPTPSPDAGRSPA